MKYINGMETTQLEEFRMNVVMKQASRIFGEEPEVKPFVLPEIVRRKRPITPRLTKQEKINKEKLEAQRPNRTAKAVAMIESCGYKVDVIDGILYFECRGETVSYNPFGGYFSSPSFKGRSMSNLFKIIR